MSIKCWLKLTLLTLVVLITLQEIRQVESFLKENYSCKCDYLVPIYIITDSMCGQSAMCNWALDYYITNMKLMDLPDKEKKLLKLKDANIYRAKWKQTIDDQFTNPLPPRALALKACESEFNECIDLMNDTLNKECARLAPTGALELEPSGQFPYKKTKGTDLLSGFFYLWNHNWSNYPGYMKRPTQTVYETKCPTYHWLNTYHYTMSWLLSTKNVKYDHTIMLPDLGDYMRHRLKIQLTCDVVEYSNTILYRNITEHQDFFCPQSDGLNRGYLCLYENDTTWKAEVADKSKLCGVLPEDIYPDNQVIIDEDFENQFIKECEDRSCEYRANY